LQEPTYTDGMSTEYVRLELKNDPKDPTNREQFQIAIAEWFKKGYVYKGFLPVTADEKGRPLIVDLVFKKPVPPNGEDGDIFDF